MAFSHGQIADLHAGLCPFELSNAAGFGMLPGCPGCGVPVGHPEFCFPMGVPMSFPCDLIGKGISELLGVGVPKEISHCLHTQWMLRRHGGGGFHGNRCHADGYQRRT